MRISIVYHLGYTHVGNTTVDAESQRKKEKKRTKNKKCFLLLRLHHHPHHPSPSSIPITKNFAPMSAYLRFGQLRFDRLIFQNRRPRTFQGKTTVQPTPGHVSSLYVGTSNSTYRGEIKPELSTYKAIYRGVNTPFICSRGPFCKVKKWRFLNYIKKLEMLTPPKC